MQTAVVILNWNGKHLLEKFLPTVMEHSMDTATVYVADNASTDDSISFLKTHFPQVKIIQNPENYGFAGGYNHALQHIHEDIYVLLNSDVEVTHGWLKPALELFNDPKVAAVQPKILDYNNREYFEYAGAAGGFIDRLGYPYCRGRIFETIEKDSGQYNQVSDIFWAGGACMFVRKTHFWKVGGFDTDYFAHQEEIDLCWRFFNEDLLVKYTPESKVFHLGGGTLQTSSPKKTYLNFRNSLFNLIKNAPKKRLFGLIFIRLTLDGIAGIRFLTQLKVRHFWAILHAHFSFYLDFNKFLKKRKRPSSNRKYYMINSIVFNHFVLKNKNNHI